MSVLCDHTYVQDGFQTTTVRGRCPMCNQIVKPISYNYHRIMDSRAVLWAWKIWWVYLIVAYFYVIATRIWSGDYEGALGYTVIITFYALLIGKKLKEWFRRPPKGQ